MAVPRREGARSAAAAATLSFLFPGAGQAYARRWRAAALFGIPALLIALLVAAELSQGSRHLAARLFDPAVLVTLALGSVALGAWRIASVIHAWRSGPRSRLAWLLLPLLLVAIVGTHGFAFVTTTSLYSAGNRMGSSGDALLEGIPLVPATEPPKQPAGSPSPSPTGPFVSPSPTPYDDYEEEPPDEEPVIDPGPTPGFDVSVIDTHTDGMLNVMLVGIDWLPGRSIRRTDTMIVVSVDTESGAVYMFSFPRDVARFPLYNGGTYSGRLNTFAGYVNRDPARFPDGGMRSLAHQLGFLLGIPIDYYAAVDIPGFERVVQAVGSVTIYNEKEINDVRIDGGSGFYLPVGEHRLGPEDTVKFVRSRKGSSDFARARRQQQVLTAMRREMVRPERLVDLPAIVDAISQVMRTDFPRDKINELVQLSEQVNDEPTNNYVFRFPEWAVHPPKSETGGRSIMMLKMDRIEALSIELFGDKSLYSR